MKNLFINEHYVNKTENHSYGESGVYETFTSDKGKLFKSLQREYGRCTSKMYIDKDGKTFHIGWVFEKIMRYTDTNEKYIQETWVSIHDAPDTITKIEHLHLMDA